MIVNQLTGFGCYVREFCVGGVRLGYSTQEGSELRLRGQWLARAGLRPGDKVRVQAVGDGVLELRVQRGVGEPDPVYVRALAGLEVAMVRG